MDSGFKVLDSEFLVSGIWILESNRQWILGSLSCIPDSEAQGTGFHSKKKLPDSGVHKQIFPAFRNPAEIPYMGRES